MKDNFFRRLLKPGMRGKLWRNFALIFILAVFAGVIDAPQYFNKSVDFVNAKTKMHIPHYNGKPFSLGLDLQGGSQLVYQVDVSNVEMKDRADAVAGVRDVIERRVNVFGVSEPIVQINQTAGGDYRIIVELAGIKDVNEAIKMIGETPLLEFKEMRTEQRVLTPEEKIKIADFNKKAEAKSEEALGKILSGGDFEAIAKEYNEEEASKQSNGDIGYVTETDRGELVSIVKDLKIGEATKDIVDTSTGFEIAKLDDKRVKKDSFTDQDLKDVKAAHILICYKDVENCTSQISKEEAYAKIKEIKEKATPANFAALAKEFSTDPNGQTGGDLGWFSKGMMVAPFEEAAFSQTVGSISYVVETKFGYHLIYKQDERSVYEYKIRHIFVKKMTEQEVIGSEQDWKNTELTGKYLKRAVVQFDPNDNSPQVSLEFDAEGAKMFEDITGRNVNKQVAIFLDSYPISAPTVNEKITGGRAVVSGRFTLQEAKLLAQRLNAGALPVPISLVSQKNVGATLGKSSIDSSYRAGIYGLLIVSLFMILYYRLPGILSVFALCVYGLLVLAVFKLWPVTLTLAGLAGFILSIGMAVDANVLIFERLKEELRDNKPLTKAIEDAFKRAWPSIRDGNYSTIITSLILIMFTTSMIKGFAVILILGIIVSIFTSMVVTRNVMLLISVKWFEDKKWLFGLNKK